LRACAAKSALSAELPIVRCVLDIHATPFPIQLASQDGVVDRQLPQRSPDHPDRLARIDPIILATDDGPDRFRHDPPLQVDTICPGDPLIAGPDGRLGGSTFAIGPTILPPGPDPGEIFQQLLPLGVTDVREQRRTDRVARIRA
jgi:hypothetical protein